MSKNKLLIIHILIFLVGSFFIFLQTPLTVILGTIMVVPGIFFFVMLVITLDFEFAKYSYAKVFRL